MFPIALHRTSIRAVAIVLLLAAGIAGARPITFAPADSGKPLVLEGRLDVLVEDYADGHTRQRHFLETSQGRVELTFARKPTQSLSSGTRVRVHGQAQGDVLALDGGTGSVEVLATVLPDTMGEQSIAVMLVNFQDDTSQPKTIADARTLVFGDASNHYLESSFGQTWFKGNVFGWYTLAMSKTECEPEKLAILADAQATQAGVNLADYQRRVYIFPANACPWQGLGSLGGTKSQAWINGLITLQVVGHELGHNYGLFHANAYDCDTGVFGERCSSIEYGDAADLMGNRRPGQFSPFAKELLGWLNDGISPPITTVTTSGRYSIEPYSASSVGPKALKIPLATDGYGRKTWYYLEYRQPIAGDSVLGTTGNLTKGVMVRYAVQGDGGTGLQLDMSPGSSTNKFDEMADGALAVGQSYFEESLGLTVTLASTSSTEATIDVLFGPKCLRAKPTVSVSGGGTAVTAGTTVGYTVTVTNRDSAGCAGATTFDLWRQVPADWTSTLGTTSMTLLPGASASAPLTVASPAAAGPGNYNVFASVTSPLGSRHASNGGVIYTVAPPPCVRAAPTVSLTGGGTVVAPGTSVGYTLKVTNRDSSSCAATNFALARSVPAGWPSALGKTGMALSPGASDSTTLNVTSLATAAGSYSIGAATSSAVGAPHTMSAATTYVVAPKLSIADVSIVEGNAGTKAATFTVKLSSAAVVPVTFNIATANGMAAAGSDYTARSLVAQSIPAGSTSTTFTVNITGDTAVEGNETFLVNVTGVKNATVADAQAVGTIRNDDTVLTIADASIGEGNSGTKLLSFTVKLSAASAAPVTFNIATANKTAAAGSDYVALALAGQSIPAGTTGKVFNVTIRGDAVREGNETFALNVGSVVGAIVGDAQAVGTIVNDD